MLRDRDLIPGTDDQAVAVHDRYASDDEAGRERRGLLSTENDLRT
jgi:hypothetical protein